jgi:Spy/CpxP family protein refolding chaperone
MNAMGKLKLVLYLAAIFIAGSVSGWVTATKMVKQRSFSPPRSDEIAASLRTCMYDRLALTEAQKEKVNGIIERTSKEMQSIHKERTDRIRLSLSNRTAQLMAVLTPEQQAQFEEIEKDRTQYWRQKEAARAKHGGRDNRKGSREKGGTNQDSSGAAPAPK